jgi:hypothetical protein
LIDEPGAGDAIHGNAGNRPGDDFPSHRRGRDAEIRRVVEKLPRAELQRASFIHGRGGGVHHEVRDLEELADVALSHGSSGRGNGRNSSDRTNAAVIRVVCTGGPGAGGIDGFDCD